MKHRILCALLCACMLLTAVPHIFRACAAQDAPVETVWKQIEAVESVTKLLPATAANESVAQIYRLVQKSDSVDRTTVRWLGADKFEFVTLDGEPCLYSARLRQKAMAAEAEESSEPLALAESYAKRGSPSGQDVYLIEPYYGLDSDFTEQYQTEAKSIAQASGGIYHLYTQSEATIDRVAEAIAMGGVIIFDSHGDTDYADGEDYVSGATTSYLCLQTGVGITDADKQKDGDTYHYYYGGSYGKMRYYMVDGTVIANHIDGSAGNGLLWSAICLGMATDGICKPLREKGLGVAYGYSQSVTFDYDYLWENAFFSKLKSGSTVAEGVAYMKQEVGDWDYQSEYTTIASARWNYAAFPIVVSDEDGYPGQGNVDNYQTVQSQWTLYPAFRVTAESSDETRGSVSVQGNVITAEPSVGCYASGAEVIKGTATVTQNENVFVVNAQTDCTVRILFADKARATLSFATPEGVSAQTIAAYADDEIVLPEPEGKPTANAHEYRFCGWTDGQIEDTTLCPTVYRAGETYRLSEGTHELTALYTYFLPQQSGELGDYVRISGEQDNYTGEYVLVYDKQKLALNGGWTDADTFGSRDAMVTLAGSAGRIAADEGAAYCFTLEAEGDSYLLRSNSGYYLYSSATSENMLQATAEREVAAQYPLRIQDNVLYTPSGAALEYHLINHYFRFCFQGVTDTLSLYRREGSGLDAYYTTVLAMHVHAYESVVVPPTEESGGYTEHTCACGDTYRDNETAPLECPSAAFDDLDTSRWYHEGIDFVLKNGYMAGTDKGFQPDTALTREMLAQILYAKEGKPEVEITGRFPDEDTSRWYAAAIEWAAENGYIAGYGNGSFGVGDAVTREQIAVILYAYEGKPAVTDSTALDSYPDAGQVSGWAKTAMVWAVENGLITGNAKGELMPKDAATRATFAVIFRAYLTKE